MLSRSEFLKRLALTGLGAALPCLPSARASDGKCRRAKGGIIRGPSGRRALSLVFTAHSYAETGWTILDELQARKIHAAFFVTGVFLDNPEFAPLIRRIVREGHYLGPHSDKHLLYLPWDGTDRLLVSREEFTADLLANLGKITRFGPSRRSLRWFLPPYEHYNQAIATWSHDLGLTLINYSPGTRSNADYTGEADRNFVASETIYKSILDQETREGLDGFILLLHLGAGPRRQDKFAFRFGPLLEELTRRGYEFPRVDKLLEKCL